MESVTTGESLIQSEFEKNTKITAGNDQKSYQAQMLWTLLVAGGLAIAALYHASAPSALISAQAPSQSLPESSRRLPVSNLDPPGGTSASASD